MGLLTSSKQKLITDTNCHTVLIIISSAPALGGLATSVCLVRGFRSGFEGNVLKNGFKELDLRSASLSRQQDCSTRNGMGDGTGSDV